MSSRPEIVRPDTSAVTYRFATTDEDIAAIHRFLLLVAVPMLAKNLGYSLDDVDVRKTMHMVHAIVNVVDGAAVIAEINGEMIGSLGMFYLDLDCLKDGHGFYGDKWFHVLEPFKNTDVGDRLRAEADAFASTNHTFFLPHPKLRRRDVPKVFPIAPTEASDVMTAT